MKRNLVTQAPLGAVRYMTQPTGGDGSAADTGAGSNPPAAPSGNGAGDGAAGSGDQSGQGQGDPAPGSSNDGQQGQGEQGGDGQTADPGDLSSFPPAAQAMIRELRQEAGNYRTAKKAAEDQASAAGDTARQELIQDLGKALGLVDSDDGSKTPSVEELTQQLTSEREAHQATKVENAVYRSAGEHEADPAALLDSRAFLEEAVKLDPSDDEFGTKISAVIEQAVEKNPKLKLAGQAPGRSGGQVNGGGAVVEQTPDQLASRIRAKRPY